ncbi:MAG: hypothetical protein WCI71_01135 [Bacteroidota bacterium]
MPQTLTGFLLLIFLSCFPLAGSSQVNTIGKEGMDSLKEHQITGNLYLGFDFTQDALQYMYLSLNAAGLYTDKHNTWGISGVINYRGMQERSTSNNGYLIFQADLWRHDFDSAVCRTKRLHAEPFTLFQFDENRGINARWQFGMYAVPAILSKSRIHLSAGIGLLYQFDRYDLLPPDYVDWWDKNDMELIYRAIQLLDPDSTGFYNLSGPRFAVSLSLISSIGKNIDLNIFVSYQQPFSSAFRNTPLYSVSSDYQTPYPCITIESILKFRILKWLALNIRYYMQHDRNQITFYLPYYMYTVTTGFTFSI